MRVESNARTNYLLENFGRETDLHKIVTQKSEQEGVLGMQISAYEGQMIQLFARLASVKTAVEIGCLYGYSALWLLEALPQDGRLYLLELDPKRVEWMKSTLSSHPKFSCIEWLAGDAQENLQKLSDKAPFDMCFIDANKAAYPKYLDWAEKNIRKGGLVLGDNTFLWGGVYDQDDSEKKNKNQVEAMKAFNSRLAEKDKYLASLVPTEEGLTVAQKLF